MYYLITAVWALVDIKSFMAVTGPKKDVWLVKTVSVLLIAISFSFMIYLYRRNDWLPPAVLAISCCIGLTIIDCFYSFNNTISAIYLGDAVVQFILTICWVIMIMKKVQAIG
jgi:hypothetical protein